MSNICHHKSKWQQDPYREVLEFHMHCLNNLCRICCNRAQKYHQRCKKPVRKCSTYAAAIKEFYGIDITTDESNVHATGLCDVCYRKMINANRPGGKKYENEKKLAAEQVSFWIKHKTESTDGGCSVCKLFEKQKVGGAPHKKKLGRPKQNYDKTDVSTSVSSRDTTSAEVQSEAPALPVSSVPAQLSTVPADENIASPPSPVSSEHPPNNTYLTDTFN